MLAFAFRRTLQSFPTVAAVALVVFVLFSVIPGSIATSMSDDGRGAMDAEVVERMRKELGLDDPVYVRFGHYVAKLAVLDLGVSFRTREPVSQLLAKRLWPTLQLVVASMALAILIGVPLGFVAAMRPGGIIDAASMFVAVSGLAIAEVLARPAADVPVRPEARMVSDLRLRRLVVPRPAGGHARRLAARAARPHDARRRARGRSTPTSCAPRAPRA